MMIRSLLRHDLLFFADSADHQQIHAHSTHERAVVDGSRLAAQVDDLLLVAVVIHCGQQQRVRVGGGSLHHIGRVACVR